MKLKLELKLTSERVKTVQVLVACQPSFSLTQIILLMTKVMMTMVMAMVMMRMVMTIDNRGDDDDGYNK